MPEELKKLLEQTVADVQARKKDAEDAKAELASLKTKYETEGQEYSAKIDSMQKTIDELAVRMNRPQGGEIQQRNDQQLAKVLRSADMANVKIVSRAEVTPASTTDSASAGITVLPEFIRQIIKSEDATTFARQLFSWQTATTPDIRQLIGYGITASHVGEGAERAKTATPTLVEVKPTWSQIYAQPEATRELLQDSAYDIESWFVQELGLAFGNALEQDILTGDGESNACLGLFNMAMEAKVDGKRDVKKFQNVSVATTAITFDDLKKLIGSLRMAYRNGASFLINHDLYVTLQTLKDDSGRYLMQPAVEKGEPDRLLGYAVYDSEYVPAVAAGATPLVFGDFKRACIGFDRPIITMLRDEITHKGFVSFYTEKRFGFMMQDTAAAKFLTIASA